MEITPQQIKDVPAAKQLIGQIKSKPEKLQLFFNVDVLEKYNSTDAFKIIRTNTSGRVSKKGVWSLDFGISAGDKLIHITVESMIHHIPEAEQDHWIDHMVTLPVSTNFLKGVIRPGCIDDGSIRDW